MSAYIADSTCGQWTTTTLGASGFRVGDIGYLMVEIEVAEVDVDHVSEAFAAA